MEFAAKPGERRHLVLEDGSRVVLDGGAHIRFNRGNPRAIALVSGQALFEVVHDPGRPFKVAVGESAVHDLGTRFTVGRGDAEIRIAVAEGSVAYRATGKTVGLVAGQKLIAPAKGSPRVEQVAVTDVGPWASPMMSYDGAPARREGCN